MLTRLVKLKIKISNKMLHYTRFEIDREMLAEGYEPEIIEKAWQEIKLYEIASLDKKLYKKSTRTKIKKITLQVFPVILSIKFFFRVFLLCGFIWLLSWLFTLYSDLANLNESYPNSKLLTSYDYPNEIFPPMSTIKKLYISTKDLKIYITDDSVSNIMLYYAKKMKEQEYEYIINVGGLEDYHRIRVCKKGDSVKKLNSPGMSCFQLAVLDIDNYSEGRYIQRYFPFYTQTINKRFVLTGRIFYDRKEML